MDGAEVIYTVLLVAILEKEWSLSKSHIEFMGSVFYLGLFFGAIFAGFLSDTIGRRKTMIICTFIEVIVVMLTAFVLEFW
jgi:MFS family permease